MKWIFYVYVFVCAMISFSISAQDTAQPKKGEGIDAFLIRNNRKKEDAQKLFDLNPGKFAKNNQLKFDQVYVLPPLSQTQEKPNQVTNPAINSTPAPNPAPAPRIEGIEPLFGPKRENYTVKENAQLKGACYFLVSGHGGRDSGVTFTIDGQQLAEDEYNYDIMLRLALNLLEEGADVQIIIQDPKDGIRDDKFLTSSTTETCLGSPIPNDQTQKLKQRSDAVNRLSAKAKEKYQRALFIHIDSQEDRQVDLYSICQEKSMGSMQLAKNIQETFRSKYKEHQPDRLFNGAVIANNNHYYVLNHTDPPSVLIECGNVHHERDQKRFLDPSNRQAVANWLTIACIKDYKNAKKK
ncbi:MAG: N-acetylmuramoyl-L-alanine amidase [Dysgonamonadaceae bacterium]|jgi:N-acetylmuramoyl-L-alanine amidase|nr:N-acetylmuramoyl-L-alanine amidase [Dysgonamonadaceae bacterium]